MDDPTILLDVVQSVGMWAVFLYLFINERKSHESTRRQYREDLREVAGLRQSINRPQAVHNHVSSPADGVLN